MTPGLDVAAAALRSTGAAAGVAGPVPGPAETEVSRRGRATPRALVAARRAAPVGAVGRTAAQAGLFASVVGFHVVDHRVIPPRWHPLTHVVAGLTAVTAAAALGADRRDLGLDPGRWRSGLRTGLVAGSIAAVAITIGSRLPAAAAVLDDPRAADLSRRDLAWRATVEITIGTSLYEELVFRSALLALARERFSEPVAVGGTAALFGLWHVLPALEDRAHNPVAKKLPLLATVGPTVAATAAAGLGFTWLRRRGGHVLAPIVTHAMVNTASLFAASAARARRRR